MGASAEIADGRAASGHEVRLWLRGCHRPDGGRGNDQRSTVRHPVPKLERRGRAEEQDVAGAEDARSILERAGSLPADIVGWSAGGLVALALAVEHPDACRSLLLIEPSVHGLRAVTPSALWMTVRARIAKLRGGQRAATELSYRWTFVYRGLRRSAWDEMPAEWRAGVLVHADAVAAEQPHEVTLSYPSSDQLRGLGRAPRVAATPAGRTIAVWQQHTAPYRIQTAAGP
jgi:pimeloyl-ACP methyl ester carboxylesterase